MQVRSTRDLRDGERRPFEGAVQVSWQTASGQTKIARARGLDLSEQGARIECDQALESRTNVYLQAPAHGLMGNATVRYCRRRGIKHVIGLMFSSALSLADTGRRRLNPGSPSTEK